MFMRRLSAMIGSIFLISILTFFKYPIAKEILLFPGYSKAITFISYMAMIILFFFESTLFVPIIFYFFPMKSKKLKSAMMASLSVCCVIITSLLFGPFGLDIPNSRLRGIFFSEWKFINVIFYYGPLCGILSGIMPFCCVFNNDDNDEPAKSHFY